MGIRVISLNATRSVFPNLLIFNKRNNEVKHLQLKLISFSATFLEGTVAALACGSLSLSGCPLQTQLLTKNNLNLGIRR